MVGKKIAKFGKALHRAWWKRWWQMLGANIRINTLASKTVYTIQMEVKIHITSVEFAFCFSCKCNMRPTEQRNSTKGMLLKNAIPFTDFFTHLYNLELNISMGVYSIHKSESKIPLEFLYLWIKEILTDFFNIMYWSNINTLFHLQLWPTSGKGKTFCDITKTTWETTLFSHRQIWLISLTPNPSEFWFLSTWTMYVLHLSPWWKAD